MSDRRRNNRDRRDRADRSDRTERQQHYERRYEREEKQAPESGVHTVQLDGLVLLKIINHCKESMPDVVTGQLLGLDIDGRLEVTSSFPLPNGLNDVDTDTYQIEMMKQLRTVNVDNNTVGWYQSAYLGTFFDQGLLDAQHTYQKHIPNSVVLIYDPFQTTKGRLVLKAYRLTDAFMRLYEKGKFTYESFIKNGMDSTDIFQEVPIKVHNSHLVHGFLYELREEKSMNTCNFDRLSLQHSSFLNKNLSILSGCIDDYANEQGRFLYYQRVVNRQKSQQQQYLQKRATENEIRIASGKDPLPEEDLSKNPLFKQIPKPNRLETYLVSNQIAYYCNQITSLAAQATQKLYVTEALAKGNTSGVESTTTPAQ